MAIALSAKTGVSNADPNFPYGKIVDGVGTGTPITAQSHQDFHQFFARMLALSGITANGLLDNNVNGYQYAEALLVLAGHGAWVDASGAFAITAVGGGTVTGYTLAYSRYRLVGKTLQWQFAFTGATITGGVSSIVVNRPTTAISGYVNAGHRFNVATSTNTVQVSLEGAFGPAQVTFSVQGGGNFSTGSGRDFYVNITAEVT